MASGRKKKAHKINMETTTQQNKNKPDLGERKNNLHNNPNTNDANPFWLKGLGENSAVGFPVWKL